MCKIFSILMILGWFVTHALDVSAATYWASPSAVSTNLQDCDGPTDPGVYCTFSSIYANMAGGDTLIGKVGTYDVRVNTPPKTGTASNKTVITCEVSADPTKGIAPSCIMQPVTISTTYTVIFSAASYWSWQNWKFDSSANASLPTCVFHTGTTDTNMSSNWELINNEFKAKSGGNQGTGAVICGRSLNAVLRGNEIHSCARDANPDCHGIYTSNNNLTIENNVFRDLGRVGGNAYCIQYYNSGGTPFTGGIIRNNKCFNANRGIIVGSSNTGAQVYGNVFYSISGTGIGLNGTNVKVHNNVSVSNGTGITNACTSGCEVRNNIFFFNGTNISGSGSTTFSNNQCPSGTGCLITSTPTFINSGDANYCVTSANGGINQGISIAGRPYNQTAPDIGVCETFAAIGATIIGTTMDISFGMNLDTPVLPPSGVTGFTVGCSGTGCGTPTVLSATRLSDSIIRLTINHSACTVAQTWTWSYSGSGNVTSSIPTPSQSQPLFAASNQSVANNCSGTPPDPPPGLYVHYKFDEGVGTSANDETANNLDGTLVNSPSWVTGRTGSAVSFADGVQDHITVPYGNALNPSTQSLTIAFDFYPTNSGSDEIYFGSSIGTNQRLYIGRRPNNTLSMGIQSSSQDDNTEFSVNTNTWYRACLVMNSSTDVATLHLNGVAGISSQSVKSYTSYTLASNFEIGRVAQGTGSLPGVIIDNLKIWNSVESCADDYAAEYPPSPPQTGTFTQVSYQFYLLRKDSANNIVKLPGTNSAANTQINVPTGAVVNLDIQTNCDNVANCDPISQTLQYEVNASGSWTPVADNCAVKVCFYGTLDTDGSIPSGVPSCPLTGALACVDGGTQRTASAIPNIDLGQNNSTVNRYVVQLNGSLNDVIRFRLVNQNGEVFGTYSQYPTITTVGNFSGAY